MSILSRSVLYYKSPNGPFRFPGWAITNTTLGSCLEPFNISDRYVHNYGLSDFDPSDIIARVDDLQPINDLNDWKVTSFDEVQPIGGGDLHPRTFLKEGKNEGSS